MSPQSRRLAGILLVILPTVMYGGVTILAFLAGDPAYSENELRQDREISGFAQEAPRPRSLRRSEPHRGAIVTVIGSTD